MGPIPACAGQPGRARAPVRRSGAYPRVCGATAIWTSPSTFSRGLSPRVRGNRWHPGRGPRSKGPIPACAGQPRPRSAWSGGCRAYPRVCGATEPWVWLIGIQSGLSPRVRGNPARSAEWRYSFGPIPACAGQPCLTSSGMCGNGAYPRVCGATHGWQVRDHGEWGLSPRVRGNPHAAHLAEPGEGPIPACAGQPLVPNSLRYKRKAGNLCLGF